MDKGSAAIIAGKKPIKLCWKLVKITLGVGVAGQRHNHFAMDLIVARACHR
jgi:hypothetical protein